MIGLFFNHRCLVFYQQSKLKIAYSFLPTIVSISRLPNLERSSTTLDLSLILSVIALRDVHISFYTDSKSEDMYGENHLLYYFLCLAVGGCETDIDTRRSLF